MIAVTTRTVPSTLTVQHSIRIQSEARTPAAPLALNMGIRQAPIDRSDHIHYS